MGADAEICEVMTQRRREGTRKVFYLNEGLEPMLMLVSLNEKTQAGMPDA